MNQEHGSGQGTASMTRDTEEEKKERTAKDSDEQTSEKNSSETEEASDKSEESRDN